MLLELVSRWCDASEPPERTTSGLQSKVVMMLIFDSTRTVSRYPDRLD
jgi:hypothetical protein